MHENLRENFVNKFTETRKRTLEIFDLADEAVLRRSPGFGFRPLLWHLAHQGTFEEYWLLQNISGANPINERFQRIFDPIKTPRENSTDLPSKAEMLGYLEAVRGNVWRVLDNFDFTASDPLRCNGYVFDLVHQHELQHQETLAYLLHLLPLDKLQIPNSEFRIPIEKRRTKDKGQRTIEIPAGETQIGAASDAFAYDNEKPAHQVFIPAFQLDTLLTTNAEFAEFVAEDGYGRKELWSAEGWQFREKENWKAPLYWRNEGDGWRIRAMFREDSLSKSQDFPVYGVSYYEAEAYAQFRGKRLPTEFEWERAASRIVPDKDAFGNIRPRPERCNFGLNYAGTTTVYNFFKPAAITECFDLSGNLWEWTTGDFAPYPNFRAFPYQDYSETWFDGDHKVLKGGSFATSGEILRTSFRNFFRRQFRIAFAGIRLAADV